MSEHKDCVSRADLLRDYIPADVARAECADALAERNLYGHLLSRIVDHWGHSLGHVNEFIANDIEQAERALAEDSHE